VAGLTVDRGYDALHRPNALGVPALGAALNTGYGYDGASRLQTVTNGQVSATYTREPNSPLLASVAFTRNAAPVMTTTRTHDFLDRQLSQATTLAGQGSAATAAGYAYNAASHEDAMTAELQDGVGVVVLSPKFPMKTPASLAGRSPAIPGSAGARGHSASRRRLRR
jgi:hypothetical protein